MLPLTLQPALRAIGKKMNTIFGAVFCILGLGAVLGFRTDLHLQYVVSTTLFGYVFIYGVILVAKGIWNDD
ncbi:MAG: hypothetical protein ACRCST_04315 [Turicibacter sp.]